MATEEYRNEAIAWLQSQGKILGTDFTAEGAIEKANDLAYDQEVKRNIESLDGGFTGFDGQNCDGPCDGWNGVDRRCDCGNRRVYWNAGDTHSFKNPYVYAEAY